MLFPRRAQELGIDGLAVVGKSVRTAGPLPSSILAEMFESVMGAIYVDGGLAQARTVYLHLHPLPLDFKDLKATVPKEFGTFTTSKP